MNKRKFFTQAFLASALLFAIPSAGQNLVIDHSKVGSIAPGAKMIEADYFHPFEQGAAVIRRGDADALIGKDGNFIIPFHKYRFEYQIGAGLFLVATKEWGYKRGILTSKGQLLHIADQQVTTERSPGGYAWIGRSNISEDLFLNHQPNTQFTCINAKGQKIVIKNASDKRFGTWSEGMVRFYHMSTGKYGFIDSTGKVAISEQYVNVKDFSEGLAAVCKLNEFGEEKWGFIDKKGNVKIPFQYSRTPSFFGNGLAVVFPRTGPIAFSLINQQGTSLVDVPTGSGWGADPDSKFTYGYLFAHGNALGGIDTRGKSFDQHDLFTRVGLPGKSMEHPEWSILHPYRNGQIIYTHRIRDARVVKRGILDLANGTYIDAVFDEITLFDPVSNLAYAKFQTGENSYGFPTYREGYVNRQGQFVIVKQEKGNW